MLREVARCEHPLYVSPRVAGGLMQPHRPAVPTGMEHHAWTLDPSPDANQQTQDHRRTVLRNIDKDYRRSVRKWADPEATSEDQVEIADGTILEPPGKDGSVPEAPQWPASHHPPPPLLCGIHRARPRK